MPFWKKANPSERVRVYDMQTKTFSSIPAAELAPGMIQVSIRRDDGGLEEGVWVDSASLKQSTYQHPPFPAEIRRYFRTLKDVLDEVNPQSLDEWEDQFRRDKDWKRELNICLRIAQVYERLVGHQPMEFARKMDIYKILLTCTMSPREQVLGVTELEVLSRSEAAQVIDEFFDGPK